MKAYFIVVKYENDDKGFVDIGVDIFGEAEQLTFDRHKAEEVVVRMTAMHGHKGIQYELHEVEV